MGHEYWFAQQIHRRWYRKDARLFFINNIFLEFSWLIFQKTSCVVQHNMQICCLHLYETKYIHNLLTDKKEKHLASFFKVTFRYIDDVLSLNNLYLNICFHLIYPCELDINNIMTVEGLTWWFKIFKLSTSHSFLRRNKMFDLSYDYHYELIDQYEMFARS